MEFIKSPYFKLSDSIIHTLCIINIYINDLSLLIY